MDIKNVIKHLPEVGTPILSAVREIEKLERKRDELQDLINKKSAALRERVKEQWTSDEIAAARAAVKEEDRQRFIKEQAAYEKRVKEQPRSSFLYGDFIK